MSEFKRSLLKSKMMNRSTNKARFWLHIFDRGGRCPVVPITTISSLNSIIVLNEEKNEGNFDGQGCFEEKLIHISVN